MTWVKIDDGFPEHPKVAQVGLLGMAMQVAGLCYCNRKLTDGFVPTSVALTLLDVSMVYDKRFPPGAEGDFVWMAQAIIDELLVAGMWLEVEGGYMIHDFLDHQPSKVEVEAEREGARERMRELRANRKRSSEDVRANFDRSSTTPVPVPVKTKSKAERSRNSSYAGDRSKINIPELGDVA